MSIFKRKPKPVILKNKSGFGKRKYIGILLIIVALIISFVLVPMINAQKNETALIAVAKTDIKKGSNITEKEITFVERGTFGLKAYITDKNQVIGKPAVTDILKGDFITNNKIGKENISRLQSIIINNKALTTITVKSNAAGLASHLKSGDIVRIYNVIGDEYSGNVIEQNPLLGRIEVYDIENSSTESLESKGKERDVMSSNEKVASTITFITVSKEQERALLQAEYNGAIHVVFVER